MLGQLFPQQIRLLIFDDTMTRWMLERLSFAFGSFKGEQLYTVVKCGGLGLWLMKSVYACACVPIGKGWLNDRDETIGLLQLLWPTWVGRRWHLPSIFKWIWTNEQWTNGQLQRLTKLSYCLLSCLVLVLFQACPYAICSSILGHFGLTASRPTAPS